MYKKTIFLFLMIVTLSSIVITAFAFSGNSPSGNQQQITSTMIDTNSNAKVPILDDTGVSTGLGVNKTAHKSALTVYTGPIFISPEEAKKIALKYIDEPGASPGNPVLVKEDSKRVYIVPVVMNKKRVGEIHLDARNGKNVGGCGGAPK